MSLAGAKVAAGIQWPGAIHEGNGKMAVFIDAKPEQRDALVSILTGKDGGLPWEILAATIKDIKGPFFETIEFDLKGTSSRAKVGNKLNIALKGLTNPVTGEPHEAHTVLPAGFIWRDGNICLSATNTVEADGVKYDHSGNSAYFADVEWSNAAPAVKGSGRF